MRSFSEDICRASDKEYRWCITDQLIWAWTTCMLAGTCLELPIVFTIIGGGTAMLVCKDEIVHRASNRGYMVSKSGGAD